MYKYALTDQPENLQSDHKMHEGCKNDKSLNLIKLQMQCLLKEKKNGRFKQP